jgi:hypothetical protein
MSYDRITTLCPTGPASEVKCANNIGIKVFAANPFVSRETGTRPTELDLEAQQATREQHLSIQVSTSPYRIRVPISPNQVPCNG